MFEIPTGKALVAVAVESKVRRECEGCACLTQKRRIRGDFNKCDCIELTCERWNRKDGQDVIFRLVDLPEQNAAGIAEAIGRCEERHERIEEAE